MNHISIVSIATFDYGATTHAQGLNYKLVVTPSYSQSNENPMAILLGWGSLYHQVGTLCKHEDVTINNLDDLHSNMYWMSW